MPTVASRGYALVVLALCGTTSCTGADSSTGDDDAAVDDTASIDASDSTAPVDDAPSLDAVPDGASDAKADAVVDAPPADCIGSTLYGKNGELWSPSGRLVDVGWAGYHTGKDAIPDVAGPITNVTDFGAKADDDVDDTAAFVKAFAAATKGVLLIPAGRFVLTERLYIHSGVVVRGAGTTKTTLYYPKSLGDVYGITFNPAGQSSWSFGGGFLSAKGSDTGAKLTTVTKNAARGDDTLTVTGTTGITVGQWVRIQQTDAAGSMLSAFYADTDPGDVAEDGGQELFDFYSPVTKVTATTITLARTLPFPIDTRWKPTVLARAPNASEIGIEHLTIEFLGTTYPGHFKERGFNAIDFSGLQDSWVRDVKIVNADYGVTLNNDFFCTGTDIVLDTNFDRGPLVGHHGLNSSSGADILYTRFDVRKTFVHDLTVDGYAFGTAWSNGKGVDLNMDHHGRSPYGTLWTALDLGAGTRPFASGGNADRMPHTGAYSTVWNLVASRPLTRPDASFGPLYNFVAMAGDKATPAVPGWSVELIDRTKLCQPDLHAAMLNRRP